MVCQAWSIKQPGLVRDEVQWTVLPTNRVVGGIVEPIIVRLLPVLRHNGHVY